MGAGAILPTFCPTDLHRAARPRIILYDRFTRPPADQAEHDADEPGRTEPNESHPAENRKVVGSSLQLDSYGRCRTSGNEVMSRLLSIVQRPSVRSARHLLAGSLVGR